MEHYFQKVGQNKRIWIRVGDTRPLLDVQLIKQSDGSYVDISSGAGHIEIYRKDGTTIQSGITVDCTTSGATGQAYYNLSNGRVSSVGIYDVVWKIDATNNGNYYSLPEKPYHYELIVS